MENGRSKLVLNSLVRFTILTLTWLCIWTLLAGNVTSSLASLSGTNLIRFTVFVIAGLLSVPAFSTF